MKPNPTPTTISACPFCEAKEKGVSSGWGMSQLGWDAMRKAHEAGHPTHSPKIGIDETMYASNQETIQTTGTTPTETVSEKKEIVCK